MEETNIEVLLGILARLGIVGAHTVELIGGIHTLTIVMILRSIEEIVAVQFNARKLRHNRAATLEVRSMESINNRQFDTASSERKWS